MNLRVELPSEAVAEIVERVLAEMTDGRVTTPPERPESPYMTVEEAAAYLRSSRQRVYDLLSQRRLSRVKDGSRTLVRRAEIEAHLMTDPRRGS